MSIGIGELVTLILMLIFVVVITWALFRRKSKKSDE